MSDSKWQNKIEEKLDKLDERMDNIDKSLAVYNALLETHIEGVKQARKENELTREALLLKEKEIKEEIKPIRKHVDLVSIGLKVIIALGTFIAFILGVLDLLKII